MPPIPIYSSSPISGQKGSGVAPGPTATENDQKNDSQIAATQRTPTKSSPQSYLPAQPGAAPFIPVQTGGPAAQSPVGPAPTRTINQEDGGPPAPQPGAAPVPPGAASASTLPPPPKAGETRNRPQQTPAPQQPQTTTTMPPQMSIPPPMTTPYAPNQGTSTDTTFSRAEAPRPVNLSHPPGYQQNANASGFGSQQRPMYQTSAAEVGGGFDGAGAGDDDGVWDQAKKWAQGAGESLAAAESEVWKRINKP